MPTGSAGPQAGGLLGAGKPNCARCPGRQTLSPGAWEVLSARAQAWHVQTELARLSGHWPQGVTPDQSDELSQREYERLWTRVTRLSLERDQSPQGPAVICPRLKELAGPGWQLSEQELTSRIQAMQNPASMNHVLRQEVMTGALHEAPWLQELIGSTLRPSTEADKHRERSGQQKTKRPRLLNLYFWRAALELFHAPPNQRTALMAEVLIAAAARDYEDGHPWPTAKRRPTHKKGARGRQHWRWQYGPEVREELRALRHLNQLMARLARESSDPCVNDVPCQQRGVRASHALRVMHERLGRRINAANLDAANPS